MAIQAQPQAAKATPKPVLISAPGMILQRKCACGGTPGPSGECEACRKKRLGIVQREAVGAAQSPSMAPSIVHDVLRSPGQPLDTGTRAFFEPRMANALGRPNALSQPAAARDLPISQPGDRHEKEADQVAEKVVSPHPPSGQVSGQGFDLSRIRIHTDQRAAESARAVNALAYTVGRDIVFGAGFYSPGSSSGQRLLAHELAHTAQQGLGLARQPGPLKPHDPTPTFTAGGCLGSAVCKDVKTPSQLLKDAKTDANTAQREKREKLCKKTPEDPGCRADGHAKRAVETEKLLNGFDSTRMKNVKGIFIDKDIEGDFGAVTTTCNKFTPALAPDGQCIVIPQKMEDNAATFNNTKGPATIDGMDGGKWRERTLEILVHEAGHADFRTSFLPGFKDKFSDAVPNIMGKPRATCRPDEDARIDVFSSANELAAMLQEFPLRLQRARTSASLSTPEAKEAELDEWRDHRIKGTSQSITNSLRVMRCLCGCEDANDMIRETIEFATTSWDQNQKNDLHREMRDPRWKDLDLRWPFLAPGTPTVTQPAPERPKSP